MNKLPHERLREFAESCGCKGCNHLASMAGSGCDEFDTCTDCINAVTAALADEIEKYYIPRPRFKDGEPVQFGDVFRTELGNVECVAIEYNEYNAWVKDGTDDDWNSCISADKLEKLSRISKVLDADGVEIKVGETLYRADHAYNAGKEVHVYGIGHIEDAPHSEIQVFTTPKCTLRSGWEIPSNLTHREPDSLEKLRDEIQKDADELEHTPYQGTRNKLNDYADRLTAIMERDA